jgi:ABC-type tungstate transport system permease subunit
MKERFFQSTPLLGLVIAAVMLLTPGLAAADNSSSLTVIGTSDVSDSGLMSNLIQPQFHAAFPQFTFKYVGTSTGNAINSAMSGAAGASVLIVHAASLENQFVAGGFSQEPFGRAIFTNDFVLGGPASGDPAGVAANGQHNIVQAFADIAAAGDNGGGTPKVTFVSRGGTPGTTVEEHQIWALVDKSGLTPSGVLLCTVSAGNGGGETPIAAGNGVSASGQPCPNNGSLPSGGQLPKWYVITGVSQGPNVVLANSCNGFQSPANTCYVLTDRGTFDFLASGTDPIGAIPNLGIVTRGPQDASAPGGPDLLVNYFHAYVINPSKPGETVNLTAAQDFVNFLTSPALQSQLKVYLDDLDPKIDPAGAPFVADASPDLTASGFPSTNNGGSSVTVTGQLTNAEVGYPALANKTVNVDELVGGVPVPVKSGTTNSSGGYSITFVPPSSGSYQVSTGQIQMIEDTSLSPVFGDLLSPAATDPVKVNVQGAVTISSTKGSAGGATATGVVSPGAPDSNATVEILARRQNSTEGFSQAGGTSLSSGQSAYAVTASLQPGKWQLETSYRDPGELSAATSRPVNVTVPPNSTTVGFKSVKVRHGKLTISGKLSQASGAGGATVKLFALRTAALSGSHSVRRIVRVRADVSFPRVGKTSLGAGKNKFTIKAKLKRGFRYVLQLQYAPKGAPSSFSKLKTVAVR